MTNPAFETDVRLKSYLDTNQFARERLAASVLSLDARVRGLSQSHPRGGPDGGRDLQGTVQVSNEYIPFVAAVGFVNNATDSQAQIRRIFKKFIEDITSKYIRDHKIRAFFFVTNLSLPLSVKADLEAKARKIGFIFVEFFDRDRISLVLNSPDGLCTRQQVLGINLSESEQASFFAKWGVSIEGLITERMASLHDAAEHIEFLVESARPIRRIQAVAQFSNSVQSSELGHVRFFCMIALQTPVKKTWWLRFGISDNHSRAYRNGSHQYDPKKNGYAGGFVNTQTEKVFDVDIFDEKAVEEWAKDKSDTDGRLTRNVYGDKMGFDSPRSSITNITANYYAEGIISSKDDMSIQDIDGSMIIFACNASMYKFIKSVNLYADAYHIFSFEYPQPLALGRKFGGTSMHFSDNELDDEWISLVPQHATCYRVDFSSRRPRRVWRPLVVEKLVKVELPLIVDPQSDPDE